MDTFGLQITTKNIMYKYGSIPMSATHFYPQVVPKCRRYPWVGLWVKERKINSVFLLVTLKRGYYLLRLEMGFYAYNYLTDLYFVTEVALEIHSLGQW